MKRYKVNSVAQYLDVIKTESLSNYIFRGQNEPYNGITATAFRPYQGSFSKDKFYDFPEMKRLYFNKVIRKLSKDERKYFSAFCQHHGLPTNLVDFTYSPLIGLFSACYGKKYPSFTIQELLQEDINLSTLRDDEKLQRILVSNLLNKVSKNYYTEYAEVYLISKDHLVDITEIIVSSEEKNITLMDALQYDSDIQISITDKIHEKFVKNSSLVKMWIANLLKSYDDNNSNIYEVYNSYDKDSDLSKYREKITKDFNLDIVLDLFWYVFNEMQDENITYGGLYLSEDEVRNASIELLGAHIYMMLLINLLQISEESKGKFIFDLDICFTYEPPDIRIYDVAILDRRENWILKYSFKATI